MHIRISIRFMVVVSLKHKGVHFHVHLCGIVLLERDKQFPVDEVRDGGECKYKRHDDDDEYTHYNSRDFSVHVSILSY